MAVIVAVVAWCYRPGAAPVPAEAASALLTAEELAAHGAGGEPPLLLGIAGEVFDVSAGAKHYGPGGGYAFFSGRDAARAFVSGEFEGEGLTDNLDGLDAADLNDVLEWSKFYHETYKYVGNLQGRFFDAQGGKTAARARLEAAVHEAERLRKEQEARERENPRCSSRWTRDTGGEVWCEPPRVPRKVTEFVAGQKRTRCACFREHSWTEDTLQLFGSCAPDASRCRVPQEKPAV